MTSSVRKLIETIHFYFGMFTLQWIILNVESNPALLFEECFSLLCMGGWGFPNGFNHIHYKKGHLQTALRKQNLTLKLRIFI